MAVLFSHLANMTSITNMGSTNDTKNVFEILIVANIVHSKRNCLKTFPRPNIFNSLIHRILILECLFIITCLTQSFLFLTWHAAN